MASARGTQLWPSLFFVHLLTIIPPVPESRGGLASAVQSPWPLPTPSFLLKISALSQILGRSRLCSRGQAAASAASNPAGIMDSSRSRLPRAGRGEGKLVAPLIHEILKDARRASSSEKAAGGRRVTSITNLDQESGYHPCEAGSTLYGIVTRRTTGE